VSQRRDPLTLSPISGTNTSIRIAAPQSGSATLRHCSGVMRLATNASASPIARPTSWRTKCGGTNSPSAKGAVAL
jgi:hypothetical protein